MKQLSSILFILLSALTAKSQLTVQSLHYRNRITNAKIDFKDDIKNHSAIFPQIIDNALPIKNEKGVLVFEQKKSNLTVYPITDLSGGIQYNSNLGAKPIYDLGIGAGVNLSSKKFFFTGKFLPYLSEGGFVRDSIQNKLGADVGTGRALTDNVFQQNELTFAYRPNRFFTFIGGNGKNFFGEGYRSLILSDNAKPAPFFKIETSFGNIKYVNIYNLWKDNTINPEDKTLDQFKYSAMHYISWNITRDFNLSVFEAVVWQSNDTLVNRGFDFNYINPIVFYRPVEFGNGSADNVLLGTNLSYKLNDKNTFYTQLVLDDFLLSEIRARSRWWANKYAFQLGYKSIDFLGKEALYFQTELNVVRPFTFSHNNSSRSYGNLNTSVTHPLGGNFAEALNILSYKKGKFRFTNKLTYSSYGLDTSAVSLGQDIFQPNVNRDREFDHFLFQGLRKNVLNETFIVETPLFKASNIYLNLTYNWRLETSDLGIQNNHMLSIGIRSRIWNRYSDF